MFCLESTPTFARQLKKFVRKHPDLHARLREVFTVLEKDPLQPELRLHPFWAEPYFARFAGRAEQLLFGLT